MKIELERVATMSEKKMSTFEREMKNAKFKRNFDKSYKKFLLSEAVLMITQDKSVRKLANATRLSPTTIQNLRSNKQSDMKVKNLINISRECGYHLVLEKGTKRILLG